MNCDIIYAMRILVVMCNLTNKEIKMEITLNDKVKEKLAEAVKLWADENLNGKPAILANIMFLSLEEEMIKKIKEIQETFK